MGVYCAETKVAFCHLPKCAGWTVKEYMARALPDLRVPRAGKYRDIEGDFSFDDRLPIGHLALRDWERVVGDDPQGYDKILAVVRDPYEREVSQWLYWRHLYFRKRQTGQPTMPQQIGAATYGWGTVRDAPEAFALWLKDHRSEYHVSYEYHDERPPKRTGEGYDDYGGFLGYWLHLDGELPDNVEIMRLERLDEALPRALAPYTDEMPELIPRRNEGPDRLDVDEYLNDEARAIIERRYPVLTGEDWYGKRGQT